MRGRKPTPTALKILRGNPGRRRLNPTEPQPRRLKTLTAPATLRPDARAIWTQLVRELRPLGLVTRLDVLKLEVLVIHLALHRQLYAQLGTATDASEIARLQRQLRAAADVVHRLGAGYGIDPAERSRLHVTRPPRADSFAPFDDRPSSKWAGILP